MYRTVSSYYICSLGSLYIDITSAVCCCSHKKLNSLFKEIISHQQTKRKPTNNDMEEKRKCHVDVGKHFLALIILTFTDDGAL